MKVIFVKKRLLSGNFCAKCDDVQRKLEESGYLESIDEVVIAEESDPQSRGMLMAKQLGVNFAPFFVVERANEAPVVYTVYFQLVKEVLSHKSSMSG